MEGIAILFQATQTPSKDGILKPIKPGGYSDSGGDIAYALMKNGCQIITPNPSPSIENDLDWVFPDTSKGIQSAISKGAKIFWLNTVLYKDHPIEKFFCKKIQIVGQLPMNTDIYDDKWVVNKLLKSNDLPIPKAHLISKDILTKHQLNIEFPAVIKPIRGRGSQGVSMVHNKKELILKESKLLLDNKYGTNLYVEQFLPGQEITITVMPPGKYHLNNKMHQMDSHWSLPAVKRFNHIDGIAPYNGVVAVTNNSTILSDKELNSNKIKEVYQQCEKAAKLVKAIAPIRIDCRSDEHDKYFLFDLNMKPNMTGASRPHRQNQDSLSAIAARKIGWKYKDLLLNMLNQKWTSS